MVESVLQFCRHVDHKPQVMISHTQHQKSSHKITLNQTSHKITLNHLLQQENVPCSFKLSFFPSVGWFEEGVNLSNSYRRRSVHNFKITPAYKDSKYTHTSKHAHNCVLEREHRHIHRHKLLPGWKLYSASPSVSHLWSSSSRASLLFLRVSAFGEPQFIR